MKRCECCERVAPLHTVGAVLPGPGGYCWREWQSCAECNPPRGLDLREDGLAAEAREQIGGA